jgi:hypothetical protein
LESTDDLTDGDLWLVIGDGPTSKARSVWDDMSLSPAHHVYLEAPQSLGDYGNPIRDWGMSVIMAQDYFLFLDDDDVFVPGALSIIRREIARYSPIPIMFRMINGTGEILWRTREITPGNVGGSMFCCPNHPDFLGVWANGAGHRSDYEFIRGTLMKYSLDWRKQLAWSGDIIIECRPDQSREN